jgi:hypothetical protein
MEQLQVSDGKLIEPYIPVFVDARNFGDMLHLIMAGFRKIMHGSPGSDNSIFKFFYSEAFIRQGSEMLQKQVICKIAGKNPVL